MYNENSMMVKNALLLFRRGVYTKIEEVPNHSNLREVVKQCLEKLEA